jgi:rhamnulokinase
MKQLDLMALDIGASNGRAILGHFDGKRLTLSELHRFENEYEIKKDLFFWDIANLLKQLKTAFSKYKKTGGKELSAFGIDTWGVDYGLLDKNGRLIDNPRAYRCATDEEMTAAWDVVSRREIFKRTGIAALNFNTVYQLYRRRLSNDIQLANADTLLLMPDLLGYFLTGDKLSEYTNVTTTGMYNPAKKDWDRGLIDALGIPGHLLTSIDRAGTLRGKMAGTIAAEVGITPAPLAAVGTHDTASAVAAIPGKGSFAFCSSGTWSLFGTETDDAVLTDEVYEANFSNEGTVQGGFRPLKNIMGLWLIQRCRRVWNNRGMNLSWDDIVAAAQNEPPFRSLIDPDKPAFFSDGDSDENMEKKIQSFCAATHQPVPETVGQVARCIYESLALKYRWAMGKLEAIKGTPIDTLNIVGGGIHNKLLNQMTADATGRRVITGPAEGACIGNLLVQAIALGELSGISDVREVVARSFDIEEYVPHHTQEWEDAYHRIIGYMEADKGSK